MSASYWEDTVAEALNEFDIKLTPEQLLSVCEAIEVSHDHYGMAHGYDCIPDPREAEVRNIRHDHKKETEHLEKAHRDQISDLESTIRGLRSRIRHLESELERSRQ